MCGDCGPYISIRRSVKVKHVSFDGLLEIDDSSITQCVVHVADQIFSSSSTDWVRSHVGRLIIRQHFPQFHGNCLVGKD